MSDVPAFQLSGVARLARPADMLDQICDHFVEHAEVARSGREALLTSKLATARIALGDRRLTIDLASRSEAGLQVARNSIAEHMFYFAGEERLELDWSQAPSPATLPNLHHVTVLGAHDVTPRMRRVRFGCADVAPFVGGDMHVRVLIPPRGRMPVWPRYREDGRIAWPEGEDALTVRAYTLREIDAGRGEFSIDVFQHAVPGIATPGGDFARDARIGDRLAVLGPGSGAVPAARRILLIGDESALPAIARIAAEVPAGTRLRAIIEVEDAAEEQPLPSAGDLELRWLHRSGPLAAEPGRLRTAGLEAIASCDPETFIWAACEKADIRAIRALVKARGHARAMSYIAWYWEQVPAPAR
jgi:NADPH-dependent ferric siderophore reductase